MKLRFGKHTATNSTIKTFFVSIETITYTFFRHHNKRREQWRQYLNAKASQRKIVVH